MTLSEYLRILAVELPHDPGAEMYVPRVTFDGDDFALSILCLIPKPGEFGRKFRLGTLTIDGDMVKGLVPEDEGPYRFVRLAMGVLDT